MIRSAIVASLLPIAALAQPVSSSYSTKDGRAATVVITCPSQDGSYTAGSCALNKPASVGYTAAAAAAIVTANAAITVFAAGTVNTGCDVVNTGSAPLYLDFTTTAAIGSATSIPLQPGQAFHCPYAPAGAVSAVAAQPQSFVAVKY